MSVKWHFILRNDSVRSCAKKAIDAATDGSVVVIRDATRTDAQNRLLHDMCGSIAEQRQFAGRQLNGEDWKRLFVDGMRRANGEHRTDVIQSLDGTGVVILGEQTRSMGIKRLNELITYIEAWCADEGIEI